ncbi:ArsR/SmtB family transcription factor [Terracoccus luteus]|uniref:ArsR family transcriptional regulator n=1 Tax=Terracoccus luteus TaxID=53356 RepID=A0A495Y1U6_9MICO|nr:metalloregulator ArsR/SmtB family transcription factor [Terracoccus luteus]MBB2987217.1 ArsR family transcriptional regulator [Terracoccus luteus]MCP2172868.1 ArsR family transcriptional regulator [Terracoccus luteus]RKT79619.1 ArsR family transcriptional regulator [Terracoccus luteus]
MSTAVTGEAVPGGHNGTATEAPGQACCTSVTRGLLSAPEAERLARSFKALGDPTRVRLLSLIAAADGGEACICDMTEVVGLSQPTVSHHMRLLTEAGLVTREQRGRWAYYAVVPGALDGLSASLVSATR